MKNNEDIIVRRGRSFTVLPDTVLTDRRLSSSARLVIAYICGRPPGWIAMVADIRDAIGLSEGAWRRVRDELRSVGVIPMDHPKRIGGGGGQVAWVLDVNLEEYYLSSPSPNLG